MHFRGVCCLQGRMVDALADRTDEGRLRLRYASGSRQQGFDPRISEWGNPLTVMGRYRLRPGGTQGSETSQYPEEEKSNETPKVAASEMGRAQTGWFRPFGVVGPAYAILE